MKDLPFDIVREILYRLPTKSVVRFRCVSKLYCQTIDDPDFARVHSIQLGKGKEEPDLIFLYDWIYGNVYELEQKGEYLKRATVSSLIDSSAFRVTGSCFTKGIFLFSICRKHGADYKILLYDPLRQERMVLSTPPNPNQTQTELSKARYALGFDSSMKVFKVVCISGRDGEQCGRADIYSSKTKSWKTAYSTLLGDENNSPVSLNGSVYWISCSRISNTYTYYLLRFDIKTEEFTLDSLPSGLGHPADYHLCSLEGYLTLWDKETIRYEAEEPSFKEVLMFIENQWKKLEIVPIDQNKRSTVDKSTYQISYCLKRNGFKLTISERLIERNASSYKLIYLCKRTLVSLKHFE